MAQPLHYTDDEASFGSQSKRDALSIPHTIQSDNQQEIVDRNLGCINTGTEIEAKGRGPTRRRIQVACLRCRKRKIKCSGDAGNGQGCSNCRSAGNTPCQFLRVNSSIVQTKVLSTASGWPYPSNDMVSQRMGICATSKMGSLPGHPSSHHRAPPLSRTPEYEVAHNPQNTYSRSSFGIDSTINYDDESSTPYSVQTSTAYILPSSPQVFMADYCGTGWNGKSWSAGLQAGRATGETIFPENDAENPLAHPGYPYAVPGQGVPANEAISVAPNPTPLTSSASGTERTLPNPASRNPFPGSTTGPITTTEATHGLPPAHEYRSGNRWVSRCEPRTSIRSNSNASFSTSTMSRAKLIPSNPQDMLFDLSPSGPNNASSPLMPSSGAFVSLELAICGAEAGDESRSRSISHDNRRMLSLSGANTYGYSRPADCYRNVETGGSNSESTLISGLPYMRPKHPSQIQDSHSHPDGRVPGLQALAGLLPYTDLCSQ
ncbi:hypothetical protein BJX99DRAFT_235612 [Aspergillus californicus]